MKTVLIGLGNPIVGDDAIGIRAVEYIRDNFPPPENIEIMTDVSAAGIGLIELFRGYKTVIIVDSIQTGKHPLGKVLRLKPEEIANALHVSDYHNMDFFTALDFCKKIYTDIPNDIVIIGIEIINVPEFSEKLSDEISKKFKDIVNQVYENILQVMKEEMKINVL